MACLRSFFCILYGNKYPVDLAIQNFVLRRMRRRRLRLRLLQSLQMLYLLYRTPCLQVAHRPKRAWVFPCPQNWFQDVLNVKQPRKLAMFDATCIEFGTCQDICRNFSATPQKCAQHVLRFPDLLFSSTRLVELLLWLDKPRLNPTTFFGKRHG